MSWLPHLGIVAPNLLVMRVKLVNTCKTLKIVIYSKFAVTIIKTAG